MASRIYGSPHVELGGRCPRQREDNGRKEAVVLSSGRGRCVVGVGGQSRGR